ncbi:hypothetical protein VT50_0231065, partial [Streptomyces antioxidans]
MADQHDPPEPQDEQRRSGPPRQPEPLDRDPWAPPAQRVAMEKKTAGDKAAGNKAAGASGAADADVADKAVGAAEQNTSAPRPPAAPAPRPRVAEQPTLTSHPAMPG